MKQVVLIYSPPLFVPVTRAQQNVFVPNCRGANDTAIIIHDDPVNNITIENCAVERWQNDGIQIYTPETSGFRITTSALGSWTPA